VINTVARMRSICELTDQSWALRHEDVLVKLLRGTLAVGFVDLTLLSTPDACEDLG
jgi:hypothetical protein